MRPWLALALLGSACRASTGVPRVESYAETGLALTSVAVTRDAGPWFWAPQVANVACGIQFMGVYNYVALPKLREGSDDVVLTGLHPAKGTEMFRDVRCSVRTAWQFADEKFGKDHETCSFAVACVVDMEQEIGPINLRAVHESGRVCRVLASEDVHLRLQIRGNVTNPATASSKQPVTALLFGTASSAKESGLSVQYLSRARPPGKSQPPQTSRHETSEFVVCGVQSFRNMLSPFVLPMWVHHYTSLGYRVALFDRHGLHSEVLADRGGVGVGAGPGAGPFDYFPHTMLDLALGRNDSGGKTRAASDFSYKVYYKEHLSAAKALAPKVTMERNTGLLDREKVVTYDHCRLLYAKARGVLYVDTDEFLYCPAEKNTYAAQGAAQLGTLHRLADEGVDEIRLDTYPYDTSSALGAGADIAALHKCLQNAATSRGGAGPYSAHHACFSSRSTYPTWMKSADLGRRCPFHYNHWACDGGKGGGRNTLCRCRVSIGPWMTLAAHTAHTDACHLMHYNPQQFVYQAGRNRRGARNKTDYDAALRATVPDSKLASIK